MHALAHMTRMVDFMTIGTEALRWGIGYSLEKEFIESLNNIVLNCQSG